MPNSIMYQEDGYVVLETNQPEQLMTEEELRIKLKKILILLKQNDNLPFELHKFTSVDEQTKYVLDNYCELDLEEGEYLQWYVVRWEK
jgi:hypothetical protein